MTCAHQDRVAGHTGTGILRWKCAVCGREETRRPVRGVAIAKPEEPRGSPSPAEIEEAYLAAGDPVNPIKVPIADCFCPWCNDARKYGPRYP